MDIDQQPGRLYVACDDGALVEVDAASGKIRDQWSLPGVPDATFFNPATVLVHVAIGNPGLIQSIDPRAGTSSLFTTAIRAKTTALAIPDRLYVFSPPHGGTLVLADE